MNRRHALILLCSSVLGCVIANAHSMPNSVVTVERRPADIRVISDMPVSELEAALRHPLSSAHWEDGLDGYVRSKIQVLDRTGRPLPLASVRLALVEGDDMLVRATLTFSPADDPLTLHYEAVIDRITSHYALVSMVNSQGAKRPLARLQAPMMTVTIGP